MISSYNMFHEHSHIDAWIYVNLASIKIPSILFLEADDVSYSLDKRRKNFEHLSELSINLSDQNNIRVFNRQLSVTQTKKILCNKFHLHYKILYKHG